MTQRIILDVDTGTDDAVAILLAVLAPELELLGITAVAGNCALDQVTENTLRVLDVLGITDIGVFAGMPAPLIRPDIERGAWSTMLDLPPARSRPRAQHAVDWLIETLRRSDGDIVLIGVAPLTNIATAIRQAPDVVPKIAELVIMGGGHAVGNATPSAEFNIWVDPEAAQLVLHCGRPIRLLPLDATHQALVTEGDCARLRELNTPAAQVAAACIAPRIAQYAQTQPLPRPGAPVHDALAVLAVLDPTILATAFVNVEVESRGEFTDGRTVCDFNRRSQRAPQVDVAVAADERRFLGQLLTILSHPGPTR